MHLSRNSALEVLAAVALFLTGAITPAAANALSGGDSDSTGKSGISALPLPARFAISRVIGRDNDGYRAVTKLGGYAIDNPGQRLSATLTEAGLEVRTGEAGIRLALTGYGYGEAIRGLDKAVPAAKGNRVEYRRGALTEWYVNGPLGLQQGFTLQRPPGEANGGPLTLALTFASAASPPLIPSLNTRLDQDARGLTLSSPDGRGLLRYAGLLAYDATGRELPAWMEVGDGAVRLRVDDAGAAYPLVVDPFIQQAKLTASDGAAADHFGQSVAISGDMVVVGAFLDDIGTISNQGSAYVFVRPGGGWTGTLTETAKLTASDGAAFDRFGFSVAISGDTVVVGAIGDNVVRQGSAYVFVRPGGGWTGTLNETTKLNASDGTVDDWFGSSVAISGDTVVVGAFRDDIGIIRDQGSAYVFVRPGGGWMGTLNETAKLSASDGAEDDQFGISVAISGDTVVVGAIGDNVGGSAYVFVRPGGGWTGTLNETAKLSASDGAAGDWFGISVAISGDTVVVGAIDWIGRGRSAYVFVRPGGGWTGTLNETAKLVASDGVADDQFGRSVAISGDTALVGASDDDIGANRDQGSAYVFVRPSGGWTGTLNETTKLNASDGAAGDVFGISVAISGDTVVVGALFDDIGTIGNEGSACVFTDVRSSPPTDIPTLELWSALVLIILIGLLAFMHIERRSA